MALNRAAGRAAAATLLLAWRPGFAQESTDRQQEEPFNYPVRDDSDVTFGMAELGIGLLTLPTAEVCVERSEAGCSKGDRSLMLSAWPLFRRNAFAGGAGVTVGLTPTTDAPRNDPPGLSRDHSRTYFTVEATGRYYLELSESLDGWVGITSGLVVVNDTFTTETGHTNAALVGPPGVTILTEGYSIGAASGLSFPLSDNWLIGGNLRLSNWFLPTIPARDPIGDEASLSGHVFTIDLALTVSFQSRIIL